jgi:hypothetical protein
MSLRTFGSKNPLLSFATAAELSALPTGYLVPGDIAFADRQLWLFQPSLTTPVTSTSIQAGTSGAGRWQSLTTFAGSPTTEFIFRPGDPSPVAGVYTDWATLVAAAAAYPGDKTIFFSDDFASIVIPAGTWDLGSGFARFQGSPRALTLGMGPFALATVVTVADGASISGVRIFDDVSIQTENTSTTPVFDASADTPAGAMFTAYIMYGLASLITKASGPVIGSTEANPSFVVIGMFDNAVLAPNPGGGPVYSAANAAVTSILGVLGFAVITGSSLSSTGSIVAQIEGVAAIIDTNQPAIPGGVLTFQRLTLSFLLGYDDTVVTPPTFGTNNAQGAFDAIKQRLPATHYIDNTVGFTLNPGPAVTLLTLPQFSAGVGSPKIQLDFSSAFLNPSIASSDLSFSLQASINSGPFSTVTGNATIATVASGETLPVTVTAQISASAGDTIDVQVLATATQTTSGSYATLRALVVHE